VPCQGQDTTSKLVGLSSHYYPCNAERQAGRKLRMQLFNYFDQTRRRNGIQVYRLRGGRAKH